MSSNKPPPTPTQELDRLLLPFLEANTAEEEEPLLTRLIDEHVSPVVKNILRLRLRSTSRDRNFFSEDFEEAYEEIQLHLLKRLRECKSDPDYSVASLRSYVATVAHNACDDYFRKKFPRRRNLKDSIRYCLTTDPNFALWQDENKGWMASLAFMDKPVTTDGPALPASELLEWLDKKLPETDLHRLDLPDLITTILETQRTAIELDELTGVIAKIRNIEDTPTASFDEEQHAFAERIPSSGASPATIAEHHEVLEQLWDEIKRLPRRHRVALLCNLRDQQGINVIMLFPVTRVASFEELANVLEISGSDFETLWGKLPLDDSSLAQYLGVTRQQVINLRRSARDRLLRRLNALNTR
ncbi:MAG TPA: hypothetical protein VFI24_06555 [Pyrinomonadaceae bacterium]|nr:hypothetical protein [Pyrinomonadaceae bacterium]